jgi:hypothetical protein
MEDEPKSKRLTEAEFDDLYGSVNESPLHLTAENLAAFNPLHIWTQMEDENGQDWLLNGAVAGNVLGHWISLKPFSADLDDGDIQVSWGGDLENPEP